MNNLRYIHIVGHETLCGYYHGGSMLKHLAISALPQ